jgi:alpha,alpha-trehalase
MDYDCRHQRHSQVASAAAFYPLWVGLASEAQAARTVENLPLFEYAFGPAVCERTEQAQTYQWDYPAGWPPIYYLVAAGLDRYGYTGDAKRIAAKYLDLATKNYFDPQPAAYLRKKKGETIEATREPGHIYEKYEVLTGEVYDAEYASRAFHGWSYGVFIWSWHYCRDAA